MAAQVLTRCGGIDFAAAALIGCWKAVQAQVAMPLRLAPE
jgi:hypothetical protein